jgi:hypothetical protein
MGRNSIARGSRDHWTANPKRYAEVAARMAAESGGRPAGEREMAYWAELRGSGLRDPRGFIIPADQPDFPTAVKFINALRETGIAVHRATRAFEAAGKTWPAGSYVVFAAQAFRPHVMDMFEPQVHPDVFPIPGGPPTPPYDNAGWTLAFQMGVRFERILDGFTGPFERVDAWNVAPPVGRVRGADAPAGYLTSRRVNNAFIAVNRLLKAGEEVHWLQSPMTANGKSHPAGTLHISSKSGTRAALDKMAAELGVDFEAASVRAPSDARRLQSPRVGLWDQYGGSMDAGWARWILEQFEFPFERVFAPALDAGDLNRRFDALIFVDGAIPGASGAARRPAEPPANVPAEYQSHLGRVTVEKTLPMLRQFIENGGTVLAIGESASNLAAHLRLPLESQLTEGGRPLPRTKYYVPGSVLAARVDPAHPLAHGMDSRADFFFENSPVFKPSSAPGATSVAWFDSKAPLRSGWAWGQHVLENGVAVAEISLGKGRVVLFGPEILKRAQPHGTFKLLFNGIYLSAAK